MKLQSLKLRNSLLVFAVLLLHGAPRAAAQATADASTSFAQTSAVPARITQAIDETQLVRLRGNVHPLARPEFDQGAVAGPMNRMLLVLQRSADQQSALDQLMLDLYNRESSTYHKWLTPDEFGKRFGPADEDIQTVTSWLQSHGFQVAKVSKGKLAIEFSGTAAQVKNAFHIDIHRFVVNGEQHWANASDPQIPLALAPVVHGLAPLNNFRPKPMHRVLGEFTKSAASSEVKPVRPEFTTPGGNFAIGPTDFATIYNVGPLWTVGTDGTNQSIAVVGVSNINLQDVADFRNLFGLPTGGTNTPVVVIDGADPGIINDGSETEAILDVQWSGAVAKNAQIHLVIAADTDIAQGLVLAMFRVIDNNSDPILSVSFGICESSLGANGNGLLQGLWEQAAAQGITVTVATGDNGSAGCEDQNAPPPNAATTGLQVSGFASTPFNVAVGGTDFNDAGTQSTYFSATNDATTLGSALSYIPESTWNKSCTNAFFGSDPESNCNSTATANKAAVITVGGSGGPSRCAIFSGATCSGYPKPAYQQFSNLTGMPADSARDTPDVSLFASSGFNKSFYVVCEADAVPSPSCQKGGTFHFLGVGGTSVPTPSFAGIMALVNQKTGQRQGNANFVLYKLAQQQFQAGTACASVASPPPNAACTFNDVTTGTITVPCKKGSLNCNTTMATDSYGVLSGYNAGAGYDLATGLGSVNANNLVTKWASAVTAFTATTTTLSLSPTSLTAGANVTVNVTVTPQSGTTKPTGDVALVSTAANGQGVDGFTLDANGMVANKTTNQLTGGTYQVTARYGGDGTFAPSISTPVNVTVAKASSTTVGSVLVASGTTFVAFTSGPAPVTLFLTATINPSGTLLPTGTVNFVDTFNGTSTTVASNVGVNAAGEAFTAGGISTFGVGNHSVVAQYSGDASFNASNSAAVTFAVASPGTFTVGGSAVTVMAGSSGMSTITVTPSGGFTGPVTISCPTLPAGVTASPNCAASPSAFTVTVPSSGNGTGTLTLNVAAPSSATSASLLPAERTLYAAGLMPARGGKGWWLLTAGTGLAAILLLLLPGRKRYRTAVALGLICVLSFTLGCNGGYGGGGGGIATTTTKISVTSTKVASGTSIAFTVTVTSTGRAPAGMVQLYDGTSTLGTATAVSSGTATINVSSLAVGTHGISAHYLGDTYTQASQSGTLSMAITGSTTVNITGTSGSTTANGTVSLTIN